MKHLEDNLQIACVNWFSLQYPKIAKLLHHSPNGGRRDAREAARFKRMGVRAGFPDLVLLTPRNHYGCLCIELKAGKGRQTENQKDWQELTQTSGNKYVVCYSFEEFRAEIENYLK